MSHQKYENLFSEITKIKTEQQQQKQRGLNDYNIVNVVRGENQEVGMHSNVIYSLLNPNGLHFQGDLFLKLFIEIVLLEIGDMGQNIEIKAEESTDENRRIDFTIKSDKYYIGIEMKVDARDLKEQIYHYHQYLKDEAKHDKNQKVIMYYLTKDGKDAPSFSRCREDGNGDFVDGVAIYRISFAQHILNWLDASQKEVKNITNLNEALENYKNIVKKITNQYLSNITPIHEYFIKDEKLFEQVQSFYHENENRFNSLAPIEKEVYLAYTKVREKITEQFFTIDLPKYLNKKLENHTTKIEIGKKNSLYKITVIDDKNANKTIFSSEENYNNSKDYVVKNGTKAFTKYRYRYDRKNINDFFYANGEVAKAYYESLIRIKGIG